jgi:hypothetical protein
MPLLLILMVFPPLVIGILVGQVALWCRRRQERRRSRLYRDSWLSGCDSRPGLPPPVVEATSEAIRVKPFRVKPFRVKPHG